MKRTNPNLLILSLCALIWTGAEVTSIVLAQTAASEAVNLKKVTIGWQHNDEDTDVDYYELAVTRADVNPNAGGEILKSGTTPYPNEEKLLDFAEGIEDGPVKVWARVVDHAGNESAWSEPLDLLNDQTPPKTITIEIVATATIREP